MWGSRLSVGTEPTLLGDGKGFGRRNGSQIRCARRACAPPRPRRLAKRRGRLNLSKEVFLETQHPLATQRSPAWPGGVVSGLPGSDAPQGLCGDTTSPETLTRAPGTSDTLLDSFGCQLSHRPDGCRGVETADEEMRLAGGPGARREAHGRLPPTVVGPRQGRLPNYPDSKAEALGVQAKVARAGPPPAALLPQATRQGPPRMSHVLGFSLVWSRPRPEESGATGPQASNHRRERRCSGK